MKKKILSLLLAALCLLGALPAYGAAPAEDTALRAVQALGILQGDGSGDLKLADDVTRAQFAKMMAASSPYRDTIGKGGLGYSLYSDVKSGHWASEYIRLAAEQGWMNGYTDGSFHPEGVITLEEACTALLRLLGFDSDSLSGSFPYAQLQKAEAVGLRKHLGAELGHRMSRGDCVQMFYNLLLAKNKDDKVYAGTLGLTVTDGVLDYGALVRSDMSGPYIAGTAETLSFTPATVYRNDKTAASAALTRGDVYYYNEKTGTLWVYDKRVSGRLEALEPSAAAPTSVTVSGAKYAVDGPDAAYRLSALSGGSSGSGSIVTLMLGMGDAVAGVMVGEGPYVAGSGARLPFTPAEIYRNGIKDTSAALKQNDIYYYDRDMAAVWIYTERVSGKIEAVSPENGDPTSITVDGKQYGIYSDRAKNRLRELGEKAKDSYVTLLLGMNDEAAVILAGSEVQGMYFGVMRSYTKSASAERDKARLQTTFKLLCTDGVEREFTADGDVSYGPSNVVMVTVRDGRLTATLAPVVRISGRVSSDGSELDGYRFAKDIHIMDVSVNGEAALIEPRRLAGVTLEPGDVRFYSVNTAGEIDNLVLDDATGDAWTYVYLTNVTPLSGMYNEDGQPVTRTYTYLLNGEKKTVASNDARVQDMSFGTFPADGMTVALALNPDGSLRFLRPLTAFTLNDLDNDTARVDNRFYRLDSKLQVYLNSDGTMYKTELSAINPYHYTLRGWCDTFSGSAGGAIRVIVATPRE